MITEASIKAALKSAPNSGKERIELKDDGMRGEGRLTLRVTVRDDGLSAEWYAVWYRDERKKSAKFGGYPLMSLVDARKVFREEYAPAISRGQDPDGVRARKAHLAGPPPPTVKALFEAYIAHLKASGKDHLGVEHFLLGSANPATGRWTGRKTTPAVKAIGATKAASEVTHLDIKPHLTEIHQRGSVSAASHVRGYISAAFSFAMKSENAYHQPAGAVNWGVTLNPVTAIPFDPNSKRVGTRHLTPSEFRLFWTWLEERSDRSFAAPALQVVMLTGQRLNEILGLMGNAEMAAEFEAKGQLAGIYDPIEKMLDWGRTKNGKPHTLPLSTRANDLMSGLHTNRHDLYFPQSRNPTEHLTIGAVGDLVREFLKCNPTFAKFTPRDLRRTWKTLSGAAGLSKDIRDRLQNHAKSDVSSRHYDRYEYLPEKRAAVKIWGEYVERILVGELDTPVVPIRETVWIGFEAGPRHVTAY